MSRRHSAEKREIIPDAKFGDLVVAKFMNTIMYEGKKSVAEAIVYGALEGIEGKVKSPIRWRSSARRSRTSRRRSKCARAASAARPTRCPSKCAPSAARPWRSAGSSSAARDRNDKTMVDRLSAELLDASNNRGAAVKKREDTHRMAEANRAFAHYRW